MMQMAYDTDGHPLLDAATVAHQLGVKVGTLRVWAKRHPGRLRRVRQGKHGSWLYRYEDARDLFADGDLSV